MGNRTLAYVLRELRYKLESLYYYATSTLFLVACRLLIAHPIFLFCVLLSVNVQWNLAVNATLMAVWLLDCAVCVFFGIYFEGKMEGKY